MVTEPTTEDSARDLAPPSSQVDVSPSRAAGRNVVYLAGLICVLLVVGLVVWTTAMLTTMRNKELSTAMERLAHISAMLADNTQSIIFGTDLILSNLQERIADAGVQTSEALQQYTATKASHMMLREMVIVSDDFDAVGIFDQNGKIIGSSLSWPPPQVNVSDRDHFVKLRDTNRNYFISEPLKSRSSGQDAIVLSRRISASDGAFLGVIAGTIGIGRFNKAYDDARLSGATSISIYRRDGVLLMSWQKSETAVDRSPEVRRFFEETMAKSEQGTLHTTDRSVHGSRELMALHAVRGYPLMINVTNDEAEVLAEWRNVAAMMLVAAATAIILIVLLGFVLMRQVKMQARMTQYVIAREAAERAQVVAEASNKAKGHFLANMSHELRTPLNAVIGFSELLMAQYFGSLNEKQAEYVSDIRKSGKHLLDLINGILDLAKVEAGRYELNESTVDIESLFDDALKLVTVGATASGITLVRNHAGKSIWVRADRRALLQVLINLLSNAIKFTSQGGTVTLAASIAVDGALTISVVDTGCGIPVARLATIFEPFQNSNSEQARVREGTGLGLSICDALVKSHGGILSIDSVVNRGTICTIRLPARRVVDIGLIVGHDRSTLRAGPPTGLRDAI